MFPADDKVHRPSMTILLRLFRLGCGNGPWGLPRKSSMSQFHPAQGTNRKVCESKLWATIFENPQICSNKEYD